VIAASLPSEIYRRITERSRNTRDFWVDVDYFGSGNVSIQLSVTGAELKFDGGFPADLYDPDHTGLPSHLTGVLLVRASKPRSLSSSFISLDHAAVTDSFGSTAAELLHQLFRSKSSEATVPNRSLQNERILRQGIISPARNAPNKA